MDTDDSRHLLDMEHCSQLFLKSSVVIIRLLSRGHLVLALMFFILHFVTPELLAFSAYMLFLALIGNLLSGQTSSSGEFSFTFFITVLMVFLPTGVFSY